MLPTQTLESQSDHLALDKVVEWAVGIEKLVEAAFLDYSSSLEHVDALRLAYRRQTVCDNDAGGGEALDTTHNLGLAPSVEPACSLVQKHDPRVAH